MDANSTLLDGLGPGLNTTINSSTLSPLPPRALADIARAFLLDTQAGWMELKMVCSALGIIYLGAHAALRRPPSARAPRTKRERKRDEDEAAARGMELSDAIMFPVSAGAMLIGLYKLIQWLQDPAILNKIMRWYLCAASVMCLGTMYAHGLELCASLVFPTYWRAGDGSLRLVDQKRRAVARCDDVGNVVSEPVGEQQQQQQQREAEQAEAESRSEIASPLPGRLGGLLTPSRRLRRAAWDLRDLLTREWLLRLYWHGLGEEVTRIKFAHMTALIMSLGTTLAYFTTESTWLSNMLGYGLSYTSFVILSPTDFLTGSLVLCSLFVYDIVMVFYTPYMLTVATKLDVPIKLTFEAAERRSMLGLGDIVVPGIVIGFALRFDLWMHYLKKIKREPIVLKTGGKDPSTSTSTSTAPGTVTVEGDGDGDGDSEGETKHIEVKAPYFNAKGSWGERVWTARGIMSLWGRTRALPPEVEATRFPKTYFHASMVGYLAGMLVTLVMVLVFQKGQPALLYLVPGVLGSILVTGLARGELRMLWTYTEDGSLDTVDVVVDLDEHGNVVRELGNMEDGKLRPKGGKDDSKSKEKRGDEGAEKEGNEKKDGEEDEKDGEKEGHGKKHFVFSVSLEVPSEEEDE